MRFFVVPLLSALLLVPASAVTTTSEIEQHARRIEGKLMAPCCGGTTLAEHYSGPAQQMKREIRDLLTEGRTDQEILDHYVAQYGNTILAMPPPRGFNALAYVLPFLLLVAGVVGLLAAMRRWQRAAQPPASTTPASEVEPEYAERIARALKNH
jgi:cytochrome c-type biogenesis protein CcmH